MLIVDMPMPKYCISCEARFICKRYIVALHEGRAEELRPMVGEKDCRIKGELVRCGECNNWLECLIKTDDDGERYSRCCLNGIAVGESFYCADGERKDLHETCTRASGKDGERDV